MRALVIDDSRAMRRILSAMLKECGFDVVEAGHGGEALAKLQELGPLDVALVDWNMPVMNGFEFVKAIRAQEQFAQMPLVMVTTETEMERVASALEAGANEYVMKPFGKDVIQEKLSMLGVVSLGA